MRKIKKIKRIFAVFLTAILEVNAMGFVPLSETEQEADFEFVSGHIDSGYSAPILEKKPEQSLLKLLGAGTLPENYSSVAKGNVTSIKNQGSLGTCWSFAAVAAMESYAITHGLVDDPDDIDLSEYALAYLTFEDNSFTDLTGTTEGDVSTTNNIYYGLKGGGNDNYIFKTLTKWAGVMEESDYAYDNTGTSLVNYDASKVKYILTNQYYINMANVEHIKNAIMENGAVTAYYNSDDYYSNSTAEYLDYYHYTYEETASDHAIAIVGWDDNIAKENFTILDSDGGTHTPLNNGAWLIKNSWGTAWGNEGYMWISYEDKVISQATACVYEIAPSSEYTYNYQHDGGNIFGYSIAFGTDKYANVFQVSGTKKQDIKAISVGVEDANRDYSIQIYLNPAEDSPESGTAMLSAPVTGSITHPGYYTIPLSNSVTVEPGDTFSVVIKFDQETDVTSAINGSVTFGANGCASVVNTCGDNQSYVYWSNRYVDLYEYYDDSSSFRVNFCIKAMAVDNTDEITATTITSVESVGLTGLKIDWQKIKEGINYTLLRSSSLNGEYTEIYTGTDTSYTDTSVAKNTEYYYKVRVFDKDDNPLDSNVKMGKVVLAATVLRTVDNTAGGATLFWDKIDGATGYNIYRSEDGGVYSKIASVQDVVTYTDETAEFFTTYNYYIKTYVDNGASIEESVASNAISISLRVADFMVNNDIMNKVVLTWHNVESADGYVIYMGATDVYGEYEPKKEIADIPAGTETYTIDISNLKRGQNAFFYIEAYYLDDGYKIRCDISPTSIYLLYEPVKNIKWYVDSYNRLCLKWDKHVSDMTVKEYYVGVYNLPDDSIVAVSGITGSNAITLSSGLLYSNTYYATVVPRNLMNTIYTYEQDPKVQIGGQMNSFNTLKLSDVICSVGDKVTLTAKLEEELVNFDYTYQWYKAPSKNGGGVPIAGATSKEYVVDVVKPEVGYYYCVVNIPYRGNKEAFTNVAEVKTQTDISQCVIEDMPAVTYIGNAHTPDINMTFNGDKLVRDVDYTLSYVNNLNVGTSTVTVTGKGLYTGKRTVTFIINKHNINEVNVSAIPNQNYTGVAIKPNITVSYNGKTLVNGTDYSLSYSNNLNVGTATITITGKGNYTGSKIISFKIIDTTPKEVTSSIVTVNQNNNIVSNVKPGTKASALITSVNEKQYIEVYSNGSKISADTAIGTGMQLCLVNNGKVVRTYTIVVTGDTSGDGKVNITDLIAVKSHILKKSILTGYKLSGGDTNGDGKVNITDFIKIKGYILKKNEI